MRRGSTKNNDLKVYREYTKTAQSRTPRGKGVKHTIFPYFEPNQSKKLTREEGLKTIDTLIQDQRLHTKEYFSF